MKALNRIVLSLASLIPVTVASGQIPVSGRPVSQLSWLDTEVVNLMNEYGLTGGMVGVMRNGVVIYQRGFGWNDSGQNVNMPENSLCRIASCTKPLTAAAIRRLEADGLLSLEDHAFNLGQPGGGILNLTPFPSLGDARLKDIRIRHLLVHEGGWDRDVSGDLTRMECTIAGDMGVSTPPGRTNTMRWILGRGLNFSPGMRSAYSNEGFLTLGLIVEAVSGQDFVSYLRTHILTQNMWIPSSDLRQGRTFEADQPVREAWYDGSLGYHCVFNDGNCVFGCSTAITNSAYGSWDHEARVSQGGMLISPATMLRHLDTYYVQSFSDDIGVPLLGEHFDGSHGGVLGGCNAHIWQRADGVNVFIFFNEDADHDSDDDPGNFASVLRDRITPELDAQTNWPALDVEGFWADAGVFTGFTSYGGYNIPFHGVADALHTLGGGSKLNLKAGTYNFVGTISTKLLIKAPLGTARIGG